MRNKIIKWSKKRSAVGDGDAYMKKRVEEAIEL